MKMTLKALSLSIALLALGCSTAPLPKAALPTSLSTDSSAPPAIALPPPALQLDSAAEALVQRALAGSPDLDRIAARLRELQAVDDAADASRWPTLTTQGGPSALKDKAFSVTDGQSKHRLRRIDAGVEFRWELDLFGKFAASRRAAAAERGAAAADLAAARVLLAHGVRSEIVRVRTAVEETRLAESSLATLRETAALESQLRAAGMRSDVDLSQLRSTIASQEAVLVPLRLEAELAPLRLRTLGDLPLADIRRVLLPSDGAKVCQMALPQDQMTEVPLAWLRQRLDVAAAEARLDAGVAGIESARAAIYPSISLAAGRSSQRDRTRNLGELLARSTQQFVGLDLAATLFDAGLRASEARAAHARAEAAAADFKRTVLVAAEEIESALARTAVTDAASSASLRARSQAEDAAFLGQQRLLAGIDSRLTALQLQRDALERGLQHIALERERCLAALDLSRALGLIEPEPPAVGEKTAAHGR